MRELDAWDTSCVDWQDRIRSGRSLLPDLPLLEKPADAALAIFDALQLPDVPGLPRLGIAAGDWFRQLVRVVFGSWDSRRQQRFIRDVFLLAPKAQSKTSYSAGLMLTGLLLNQRPRAEFIIVAPTQAIADRAYDQAVGMVEANAELKRYFRPRHHIKVISDLRNASELRVRTFDLNILTGSILVFVLVDELHLLGRNPHTSKVLRQIRGGLEKTPEGLLLITSTQSDEVPAGAFRDELHLARKVRDGEFRGKPIRPLLPILYEFPMDIAQDETKWADPDSWSMVMPNLGRSVRVESLALDWQSEKAKGPAATRVWASQHLNIEIGLGLRTDRWPGAEFWTAGEDPELDLDLLLSRSEITVIGIDGGGLDDLFGLAVLGREKISRQWLVWTHSWCHRGLLERHTAIAARLEQAAEAGELTIVDDRLDDLGEIVAMVEDIKHRGKLAMVAVDPAGLGELIEALADIGVTQEEKLLIGAPQGFGMMNALKTCERKLANGTLKHARSGLMSWCVSNIKIEPTATAIRATKQNAQQNKIDPVMAMFNAATVMVRDPAKAPEYRLFFVA